MAFLIDALVVPTNIVFDYTSDPPPSVVVSDIQTGVVFFYDNENPDPIPGSIQLNNGDTALTNYNGNFHFLSALPFATPTVSSGSNSYNLVVGQNLSKDGNTTVNCANLTLTFSNAGGGDAPDPPTSTATRNCNAIPIEQTYLFNPFIVPNLGSFNTVEIKVQVGQNLGIQNDVSVLIFGDTPSRANPLIGVINSAGDQFTFSTSSVGNIYLMAFVEPTQAQTGGKTVVTFQSGDPRTDSKITFNDDTLEENIEEVADNGGSSGEKSTSSDGSDKKGCLGFLGLW